MKAQEINRIILAAVLLASIAALSANIVFLLSQKPFLVSGTARPDQEAIVALLGKMAPGGSLRPGAVSDAIVLRKNDGNQVLIRVAEGRFDDATITPTEVWSKILAKPSLIVSSADEKLRTEGGINGKIGVGCSIHEVPSKLRTGTTKVSPCSGTYQKAFPNIRYVGSAIVVAYEVVDATPNCKFDLTQTAIGPNAPGYVQCMKTAISDSLWDLFNKPDMEGIDTLVLPALGTGIGQLSKGVFYQAATSSMGKCLSTPGCDLKLPHNLVFAVMSGAKGGWPETRDAIARNLVYLGDDWTSHYSPIGSIQKQARYLGVLLVLIAFVLAPSFRSILPAHFTKRLTIIDGASLWLLVVGWFFVAAGAFSVLSDFADVSVNPLSPHAVRDVIVNVGFGVVAAVACGFISRATKFFSDGQTTAR